MAQMKPITRQEYVQRILRVLVHIQHHLDDALDLDVLARIANFSPFHFHRIFTGLTGESVKQHVRRLRLERAAMRLKHTDRPVTSIAFEAGYETHEAFTRAFRSAFDSSPTEFRAQTGLSAQITSPSRIHFEAADDRIEFVPLGQEPSMHVEIKAIQPARVAFIRHVGPYDQVGSTWRRLMSWAQQARVFGPGTQLFGACWDDPEVTPDERIRYDACVTVSGGIEAEGDVGIQTLGGGRYAAVIHEGPYEGLHETYARLLGQWFAAGREAPGDPPSLEFYLNQPGATPPQDLRTRLCMPISR